MSDPLFSPEIRLMLEDQDAEGLRAFCEDLHPATLAPALDDFPPEQIWDILSHSEVRKQASIFEYLPQTVQTGMLELDRPQVGGLIGKMSHDDRVSLMRRIPTRLREKLLRIVDEAERKDIATLVEHGANTVGAIMTTDYAWLPPNLTAGEAIEQLRQQAPDRETIYYIYVLDELRRRPDSGTWSRKLLGIVSLRDLILASRDVQISDIMSDEVVGLRSSDDGEKAAQLLARYDFIAIPVIDSDGGMLGIVTHDDVIDVIQEEATEDLQKQAGVGRIEGSFLEASLFRVWLSRVQILAILFLLQMITVNAMAWNEEKIRISAALIACLPLVMSVGGNAGSQAATLVVRALSLEQITPQDWLRVLGRELMIGLALAGCLGLLALLRTYFLTPSSLTPNADVLMKLSYVLALSVLAVCLWGTLLGAVLPLMFQRIGYDPALVSGPAIATASDVAGIFIYSHIALMFF